MRHYPSRVTHVLVLAALALSLLAAYASGQGPGHPVRRAPKRGSYRQAFELRREESVPDERRRLDRDLWPQLSQNKTPIAPDAIRFLITARANRNLLTKLEQTAIPATLEITAVSPSSGEVRSVLREIMSHRALTDRPNTSALQGPAIRRALKRHRMGTLVIPPESEVDGSEVVRHLGSTGFVAKAYSAPSVIEEKMNYLATRPSSHRVLVFDFSPKSSGTLTEWQLPPGDLKSWTLASIRINGSVQDAAAANRPNNPDVRYSTRVADFFDALKSAGEGTVIVVYGHATLDQIWIESSDQGTTSIDKQTLQRFFEQNPAERRASIVLLNCRTEEQLASTFRDNGSPLVFATDLPVEVNRAAEWMAGYMKRVARGDDALDAVYDQLKARPLARMTPGMDE